MTQKYPDGTKVISPGTVIVSAGGEVSDVRKVVSPVMVNEPKSAFYHIDFSFDTLRLGGSAFAQSLNCVGSDVPSVENPEYFAEAFDAVQKLVNEGLILAGHDVSAGGLITTLLEMCFANVDGGMEIDLNAIAENDIVKLLFAENPALVIQVADKDKCRMQDILDNAGICFVKIGVPSKKRQIAVAKDKRTRLFDIDHYRDVWYDSSYLMDRKQSFNGCADERLRNYKVQPLRFRLPANFTGMLESYGMSADRREKSCVRAAIIREKGTNGEREMAYAMHLAGFDVKDVTMTDLISGRETLDEVNFIVFCGGFSNSDVLGSAKGWAGGFLFNPQAKAALDRFYQREDTLSLGICNGCQLMMELNLINPEHEERGYMRHNNSHKFESSIVGVNIPENNSVLFGSLSNSRLGVWVAHGEGKFDLPYEAERYNIVARYAYDGYPANPNGSAYNVAALASANGRHVAMMPHPERAIFPWQCANYPQNHVADDVTPWIEIFRNAYNWVVEKTK